MICRGHLPVVGHGVHAFRVNKDVAPFILYFLPKGQKPTRQSMTKVVKHFHLAFKGMDTEEIYDVLMENLVQAINGYDPDYKKKVKRVAEVIDNELSKWKQFTVADINRHVGLDCRRYIRLLVRVGFLRTVQTEEGGEVARTDTWPPPAEFFKGSPIGITYYLQKWFRFHLQE